MKKERYIKLTGGLLLAAILYSCGVKRYIPEGEVLYQGATIELSSEELIDDQKQLKRELDSLLFPQPNSTILGLRLGLLAHHKAKKKRPGFFYRFLNKSIGESPVYLSDIDYKKTSELISNRLENKGFFNSSTIFSVDESAKNNQVTYAASVTEPYKLQQYRLDSLPTNIYQEIQASFSESPIIKGTRFDLSSLKLERERIDRHLKSRGYYNFNPDFLIFEVDTNQYKEKRFDLFLRLKKETPKRSMVPYELNAINVYPHYSVDTLGVQIDTTDYANINFIQNPVFFKPKRLEPYILFKKGQHYNPEKSRLTSSRLASIGAYKFVNIRFDELNPEDTLMVKHKIDANIFLSPLNKRVIRTELQTVTKSNNFAGPTLALTYSNRNLFKGGETLNITGSFGYEAQLGGGNSRGLTSSQLGFKTDLIYPRVLFPIKIVDEFQYAVPKTKISLGVEFLNRSKLYNLNSVNSTFGYGWNKNKYVYHEIDPISISYVKLSNTTPEFETILEQNPFLRNSFQQQFIAGLTYRFNYNELSDVNISNPIFFNANIDLAGNLIGLFAKSTDASGNKTLLGQPYAQYAKVDMDFRYHFKLGNEEVLVARVFGGLGLPYGNSSALPFSKQYFSGGPYSVRGFRTRSLGPGSYDPTNNDLGTFFDRSGDIRLEANLEYRFPIFSYFKGAFFADAGNIWLTNENPVLPGGKFTSSFIKELGVDLGLGLRVDIQNFVIRFDLAAPLRKPFLPLGKRTEFDIKNPILNFAIGYPF